MLVQSLGEGRVIRHASRRGLSRSFAEIVLLPIAAEADFVLLLHDDVAMDPEAVARMVEATQLPGVENAGIVGAKVVDWDQPRRLRDVGRSADRFGHPYSALQDGEIDQGQFDRVLDVLAVDSCAMLVARDVWRTVGLFDERLGDDYGDLDLCWRARIAGWRVLMTPLARVRHRAEGEGDERPGAERSNRFEEDRAALAAALKNYGPISLLRMVPLGLLLTIVRAVFLFLGRRFEEGYELAAAVGWNLAHVPGTLARRRRVQKARRVKDRALRHFTESAGLRLPRWFQSAEKILEEQLELEDEDAGQPVTRRLRHHTASLVATHPVMVAASLAIAAGALAARHLVGPESLAGGSLPVFPSQPGDLIREFVSAYRTTGLGGSLSASPAVGVMGGLSFLLFGSTALAQKVLLAGSFGLIAVLSYRAAVRLTGKPGPSVVASAGLCLSAIALWSFSEGRIGTLVALALIPASMERSEKAFREGALADGRWRFIAGTSVTLALGIAFAPGVLLAVCVMFAVQLVAGRARVRGSGVVLASLIGAAVLLFPYVPTLVAGGGRVLGSSVGTADISALLRMAPGQGPGSWAIALFLPVGAVLALAVCREPMRAPANRAALTSVLAMALAWLSAAGYLPHPVSSPEIYLATAAASQALLLAFGLASVVGVERESFGFRQVGTALLTFVLTGGLLLQALVAMTATWAVGGEDRIPAAWAVVDSADTGSFRVLWLGADNGKTFPSPGGDAQGVVLTDSGAWRYAITDRSGMQATDIGRPLTGPGADALETSIAQIMSGATSHGGALLAQFAVRYVVAEENELPDDARGFLDGQADLNLVNAAGLVIYRDAITLPPAAALDVPGREAEIFTSDEPMQIQRLGTASAHPLEPVEGGFEGSTGGELVFLSYGFDGAWQMERAGETVDAQRAFGWATLFPAGETSVAVRYTTQLPRTVGVWILGALWIGALWITRKPVVR